MHGLTTEITKCLTVVSCIIDMLTLNFVLASSQHGTCSALRTNLNRTIGANDTVTVTIFKHENYQGR